MYGYLIPVPGSPNETRLLGYLQEMEALRHTVLVLLVPLIVGSEGFYRLRPWSAAALVFTQMGGSQGQITFKLADMLLILPGV
jgi:hypothetical protein